MIATLIIDSYENKKKRKINKLSANVIKEKTRLTLSSGVITNNTIIQIKQYPDKIINSDKYEIMYTGNNSYRPNHYLVTDRNSKFTTTLNSDVELMEFMKRRYNT